MKKIILSVLLCGVIIGLNSCKSDDDNPHTTDNVQLAKENYANIVLAGYEDSRTKAVELKEAIDAFVANPTQAGMDTAKQAWYDSREPYGQTEAFRFANGPIDSGDEAVEGLLNAWPLDESFVDYVGHAAGPDGDDSNINIISNTTDYPTITKELLRSLNEYNGNERSISVGYHGIEFLLWGQDTQIPTQGAEHTTGGNRPYTDFVDGGTATHQDRRRQYLKIAAEILVEDLDYLINEWKAGGNYRTEFLNMDNDDALRNMLTGIGVLVGAELAEERILVAVANESQEDEHSCFSDNTHRDVWTNYMGVKNVYTGKYTRIDGSVVEGKSIEDLLQAANAEKATEITAEFASVEGYIGQTTIPFDYSITQDAEAWNNVVNGLRNLGDDFAETASILGVGTFEVEVP